ncbi:hypothetical protein NP233_g2091 [Leucocoprinus birnbaumii]|uniref:OTU domain-containing protein n=1 Tax=Leucocoprinus birnbaumii TaxID=56174 RepID=A0AAD5VYV7_9AGAR|nr:hypothetical protein NP233_g2091 [Leucocoprinus birnbaumii]
MVKKNKSKSKAAPLPPAPVADPVDDDLMDDLLAQLDSRDQTVKQESAAVLDEIHIQKQAEQLEQKPKQSAKNRFQARLARKAAALAQSIVPDDPDDQARLEKEAKDEEEAIDRICKQRGRRVYQINPDGHCLFSAIADQLTLLGKLPSSQATYATMRAAAASYIESHVDDFLPFLPTTDEPDEGSGLMSPEQFQQYCHSIRCSSVWGGEPEILALSRAFRTPIYVVQGGVPPIVVHDPSGDASANNVITQDGVWLSYHRKLYGLGEHYNSLRPAPPS